MILCVSLSETLPIAAPSFTNHIAIARRSGVDLKTYELLLYPEGGVDSVSHLGAHCVARLFRWDKGKRHYIGLFVILNT